MFPCSPWPIDRVVAELWFALHEGAKDQVDEAYTFYLAATTDSMS
jgi:hypothetical protein